MREIRSYGSEGGGAVRSPYPYQIKFVCPPEFFSQWKREDESLTELPI